MESISHEFTKATPKLIREKTTLSSSSSSSEKRDPVHVFCRLRPLEEVDTPCVNVLSTTTLTVSSPLESKILRKDLHYLFKHIFTSYSSQREVFEHVALPLIEDVVKGKNGLLFTYGVTGSGKTYTLTGEPNNPGIMPRCVDTIFNTIKEHQAEKYIIKSDKMNSFEVQSESEAYEDRLLEARGQSKTPRSLKRNHGDPKPQYTNDGIRVFNINENNLYSVFVSYIEIYNNNVYDLLDESSGRALQTKIVREDFNKNMYINGVVESEVKSASEAFDLFYLGQKRKRMAQTILNAESSRSHSIFNIRVVQLEQVSHNSNGRNVIPEGNVIKVGQLSLVDLAGSERSSRTQNTGIRLKEASSINNSLMSLRACLEILRENQLNKGNRLVPYRDSRLTLLFKNYFEGEGQVKMIVCVNPSIKDYEENLQVLKFAEMTKDVTVVRGDVKNIAARKTPKTPRVQTPATVKAAPSKNPSFSVMPKIPLVKFNFDNPEEIGASLERLQKVLSIRQEKMKALDQELSKKEKFFRKRLLGLNQENLVSKAEVTSVNTLLKKEKTKTRNLETKIDNLDTENRSLTSKNDELDNIIKSLRQTIEEKDLRINRNFLEREKNKQKLAQKEVLMSHELDLKLKRQRDQIQACIQVKDAQIQKAKEILEGKVPIGNGGTTSTVESEPVVANEPLHTPHTTRRNPVVQTSNKRYRRSKSAGEVWLEHNSVKPIALGTVLQPTMKRRKSVSKLSKASDVTNPKQNKYCLIAQEPDREGELETKLYKADIIPTCGGGAQVVFNDVERLRQESPTATPASTNN